nr:hypothetical protein [uncultured Mediterranean phage uvMED]
MPRYKLINGKQIQLTAEEEALRDADENQETINKEAKINAAVTKQNNKTSAQNKLKALGLTDAEIEAL